jgi:TRAP transporter TAXI family solute receptor
MIRMSIRALSVVALFVLAALTAGIALRETTVSQRVTIAAGPDEGEAHALATAIAEVAERHYPRLSVEVVETAGAGQNMRLLEEGRVELATVQADARMGPSARMIAILYPDVFQLIVREDSGIERVADLVGKRIALPPQGGGQFSTFWFLAEHYDLDPAGLQAVPMSPASASWALIDGAVDATFRVRAAGNPAILELIEAVPTRLIPLGQAAAMQLRRPALQPGTIPRGSYRGFPALPESDLPTVAVQRLLIARGSLDDAVALKLTRILFERRRELMNLTSLPPNLGGGTYIPVHPGAQQFYDRDRPSFIQENAEPLALVVTLAALMISGLVQLGSRRRKRRIDLYNKEVLDLAASLDRSTDLNEVRRCRERLFELAAGVVEDAEVGLISPEGFNFFWFTWSMVNGRVEEQASVLEATASAASAPAPEEGS